MNESQLTQVLDGVNEATAFQPGESQQLLPAVSLDAKAVAAHDTIVESAARLAADMVAIYQERADEAQRKLTTIKELAERMVSAATKTAEEVTSLNARDRKIGEGFSRVLEENGITFDGEI